MQEEIIICMETSFDFVTNQVAFRFFHEQIEKKKIGTLILKA